ncbi:MAG TPA: DNA-3-methyladenine glycosylase I [Coriobacteriia bacterium]
MHAPEKIEPKSLADYLAVMTRVVFEPGLNWAVIEAKWPGFIEAFHGFDPLIVAGLTPADVEALLLDSRIIRNRKKIEATIHNAGEMVALEREFGDFRAYLRSHGSYDATARDMRSRFRFLGETGIYHFLYVVGEDVPDHDDWMASHPASNAPSAWNHRG